jgi:hypothetical protein
MFSISWRWSEEKVCACAGAAAGDARKIVAASKITVCGLDVIAIVLFAVIDRI